jgi:hypothetical protein
MQSALSDLCQIAFQALKLALLMLDNSGWEESAVKSGASLLEKGLLPLVKERLVNVVLVAHAAHRHVLDQIFSQYAHLLFGGAVTN